MNDNDNSLKTIVEDNSGGLSSIRVLMLVWGIGAFLVWATAAIIGLLHNHDIKLPSLPPEIITILLGVTGIKAVQRYGEKPSSTPPQ